MDDLSYHLQVDGPSVRLAAPAERAIFSIVQEAVGNARKHAQAQNLWITVAPQQGDLWVGVRDDGQGFDLEELSTEYDRRGSLGMLNMHERAEAIGGKLSIQSRPGGGTTISLTVPLSPLPEAQSSIQP